MRIFLLFAGTIWVFGLFVQTRHMHVVCGAPSNSCFVLAIKKQQLKPQWTYWLWQERGGYGRQERQKYQLIQQVAVRLTKQS